MCGFGRKKKTLLLEFNYELPPRSLFVPTQTFSSNYITFDGSDDSVNFCNKSKYLFPYYFGRARSKGLATLRNVSKLPFSTRLGTQGL